jgi:IMP dehydrogenase
MAIKQTLSFDDVLLVPRGSGIRTRDEVDLGTSIGDNKFAIPIISSPMDTVTEVEMMVSMARQGGLGILHRYKSAPEQVKILQEARDILESESSSSAGKLSAAIGASKESVRRAGDLIEAGARLICVDVAHGHHVLVERTIKDLKDKYAESIAIIAGNVATPKGYSDLSEWGADAVRIGIGGGSICSTRIQTGHGVPTFQSVYDCRDTPGAAIIADGGIKTSGDIVKALAAGADFVMLGSMLAGTDESPGEVLSTNDDKRYKVYRGMASVEAQVAWRGQARSLEGISTTIPYKGSVVDIMTKLIKNVKSGLSYSGARSIPEMQSVAQFIQQSSAGQLESSTHILSR